MSGGHFDHEQYKIGYIADSVEQLILTNDSTEVNEYGDDIGRHYPEDIIQEFKTGLKYLKLAQIYAQRIDWLVSGDDGEDSFRRRLQQDLEALNDIS